MLNVVSKTDNYRYVIDPLSNITRPGISNNDGSSISSDDDVESIMAHHPTLPLPDKQVTIFLNLEKKFN